MHLATVALMAFVASAAAGETRKYTRAAPFQLGLRIRDVDTAYAPETTECGEGESCAEACGEGYMECMANGAANHCYKPAAGETCCAYTGNGNSCEAGYFCAHNAESKTTCCAEGKSLDECAKVNKVDALTSDPAEPTYTTSAKASKSTESAMADYPTTTTDSYAPTKPATVPKPTVAVVDQSSAGRFGTATAAVVLAAGAFAALL